MRRSTQSSDYVCWWCRESTEAETGYRGYDPDDPLMAEFGGMTKAIVCGPGCPGTPTNGVITVAEGSWRWNNSDMFEVAS